MQMNKNIIALGFVSFFTDIASSMVTPLIPIFVVYFLHEDVQTLSEIIALTTFASYALRIVFGYLGDKYQITKPFVVAGYFISALTKPLFHWASSWQDIVFLQTIERMGKAIRSASKDSLISAYVEPNKSGLAFGFHKMMDIAGELVGALIVFATLSWLGQSEGLIKTLFAYTIIPGLIAVVIVIFFVKDAPYLGKRGVYQWEKSDLQLLPLLTIYFIFLVFIFNSSFFVIKASELGYEVALIPLFFIVLNITQTLTSYHIGMSVDKIGAVNILMFAFVFGVLCQLCLYLNLIWLSFIFLGLFTVCSLNATRSYISHHAKNKATIFGVFYAGTAIFSTLGALIVGYIWNHHGSTYALFICTISTAILTLLLVLTKPYYLGNKH
jgi:MFS family permease